MRLCIAIAVLVSVLGCKYTRLATAGKHLGYGDVIVVPGYALSEDGKAYGVLYNRVGMAKILMAQGYSKQILFTGGPGNKANVPEAKRMADIAISMGIDPGVILVEPEALSTVENGAFSAVLIKNNSWKSAILVSNYWHLVYALPVFRDAFTPRNIKLFHIPVSERLLKSNGLYRDPESVVAP